MTRPETPDRGAADDTAKATFAEEMKRPGKQPADRPSRMTFAYDWLRVMDQRREFLRRPHASDQSQSIGKQVEEVGHPVLDGL